jgi:hypothetical protein
MYVRRLLPPIALTLFAIGCTDGSGVRSTASQPAAPHFLRWSGTNAPQFTALGSLVGGVVVSPASGVFMGPPNEISLEQNTAQFWAVRGEERSLQINYRSSTGETNAPFLRLVTVDPKYVPGRGDLELGDSVLVTVTVDPRDLIVSFEPTGLRFGNPSQLQISYGGASGDLNGDGLVDGSDAQIEGQLLGLWYREDSTDPWSEIPAAQSVAEKSFSSELQHFSYYAVSW